jgi:hypothetical protein
MFIFLCANTEIGQLLKLPNLIHHFTEHQDHDNNHEISLVDFITIHYNTSNNHHTNKDKGEHQKLPFKSINTSVNTILAFENQTVFSFSKPNIISLYLTVPFPQEFYSSNVFDCIWLPPKLS